MAYGNLLVEFRKLMNIIRWQNEFRFKKTNDAEHMWFVSVIALGLARWEENKFGAKIDYKLLAHITILHDTAELLTGDILSGVKHYTKEMHNEVKKTEQGIYADKLEKKIPKSWREDYRKYILDAKEQGIEGEILNAADNIDALFECIEEIQLGNTRFKAKLLEVIDLLLESPIQSAKYFLKFSLQDLGLPLESYGQKTSDYINDLEFDDI